VGRIWGVGKVSAESLRRISITTIGQLRQLTKETLIQLFGASGEHYWLLAQGIDQRRVVPDREAKSISSETTFAEDIVELDSLNAWLITLVEQVARRVQSNVRELEGALTRLVAVGRLSGMPVTMELAARVLNEAVYPNPKRILEPEQVVATVAEHFSLTVEQLRGPKRDREIVTPRQIAAYLSREETDASLVRIGAALGGRDHSTIIHACTKIEREMSYDGELRREVALLREALLRLGQGVAARP
jgi:nucleotidyltransferase/DNA polymerase involved in DNA repair